MGACHRYGVVGAKDWTGQCLRHHRHGGKAEAPRTAPSNLIISGRYILQPEIFAEIEKQEPGAGGEIQLTDAMIRLMARTAVLRREVSRARPMTAATRWASSPANVAFALERDDLAPASAKR